jgi:AcrR family transcriptional regulator
MEPVRQDQRRETGLRTRERLLDAALELIAERGEERVTLRELTDVAGANIASVSYHFGSLGSLCETAIEQALERYLVAQRESVSAFGAESTLEELAAAFARPMISSLRAGGRDFAVMRIVARTGIDPLRGSGRLDPLFEQIRADALRVLKANVRGLKDAEAVFRIRCAAGLLNWLVLAPIGAELIGKSERQLERLLVPILVGTFRGTSSG